MNQNKTIFKSIPSLPTEMNTTLQIVLNGLPSKHSKRAYFRAIRDFLNYWLEKGQPIPDKLFLQTYLVEMQEQGMGESSINIRLAAIKNFSREASETCRIQQRKKHCDGSCQH